MAFSLSLGDSSIDYSDIEFTNSAPPPLTRVVEPVGFRFWSIYVPDPLTEAEEEANSPTSPTGGNKSASNNKDFPSSSGSAKKQKVVVLTEEEYEIDWYEVMDLAEGEGASQDQIKTQYRKRCLETHPDKQPDKSDELFKKVQRAFEILGDPDAKRSFDCSRPFDDTIPPEVVPEKEFYRIFGAAFDRNKRWSAVPDAPSLGDDDDDMKSVQRFYDFWLAFRSWRDFTHEAQEDLEKIDDSMSRYEKRFYEKENQKILEQYRRAERDRVRRLVERAQKNDPRLRRVAEEKERERLMVKQRKEDEIRKQEELAARKKADAEAKAKAEEEAKKRAAQEHKEAMQTAKRDTATFFNEAKILQSDQSKVFQTEAVKAANLQWYFSNCNREEAEACAADVKACSAKPADAVAIMNAKVEALEQRLRKTRYGETISSSSAASASPAKDGASASAAAAKPTAVVWSVDDLNQLAKAISKFPAGTVDRWRRIATFLRNKFTEEEVLAKTKEMEAALKGGRSPAELAKSHQDPEQLKKVQAAKASKEATATGAEDAAAPASATAAPASPTDPSAPSAELSVEDWTPKQQQQLEGMLREYQAYKEKDKFLKIAAGVSGKSAKQCFERWKYLCSLSKKK